MSRRTVSEQAYEFITEDTDNACQDIPESACREAPGNFFLNAANGTLTKLAETIASPGLVLPWLLASVGAPASLSGFLVPVRRGGALIPQLAVSGYIRAFSKRKWFWVGAGLTQAASLGLMVPSVLLFNGLTAGVMVVILLGVFSIASGIGSVSYKDVLAKTIPKGKRGTLLSVRAAAGGLLSLFAGLLMAKFLGDEESTAAYIVLAGSAAILWLISALLFAFIKETEGATGGSRNALKEAVAGIHLLKKQPGFRKFVMVRSLLLGLQLAVPFYALYARELTGTGAGSLGFFVVASSLAMVVSSPFWGRFADKKSHIVLILGGIIGAFAGVLALLLGWLPEYFHSDIWFAFVFFFAGFAQAAVRLGRKTYLVDAAPERDRPTYVALSNTIVGLFTLAGASLGFIADAAGLEILIMVFVFIILSGTAVSLTLPESSNMLKDEA
ncbi:MAG: MFS transporter [Balneolaceae bacterium]|nr:MAG: MFS transporter [Balneolaceae bacterium]